MAIQSNGQQSRAYDRVHAGASWSSASNRPADLVRDVLGGDPAAANALSELVLPSAYRAALRIVHNHHSAEDVAQDAVVHGLKRLSNLRDHSQVTAWMKRIAVNLARRSLLKGRKEPTGNSEAYEGVTADLPDQRFETPELKAQREEEAIRVRHAVRALPKHLRQTMNILVVDGKLQSEAATELGIPVGTVKRRAFQARALLKQWLSGMEK